MHSSRMHTTRLRVVWGGEGRHSDLVPGGGGVDILTWSGGEGRG